MIPRWHGTGRGIRGLIAYITHDPAFVDDDGTLVKPVTSARVAWVETINSPTDDPRLTALIMRGLVRDAPMLKRLAGDSGQGRKLEQPAFHMTASWEIGTEGSPLHSRPRSPTRSAWASAHTRRYVPTASDQLQSAGSRHAGRKREACNASVRQGRVNVIGLGLRIKLRIGIGVGRPVQRQDGWALGIGRRLGERGHTTEPIQARQTPDAERACPISRRFREADRSTDTRALSHAARPRTRQRVRSGAQRNRPIKKRGTEELQSGPRPWRPARR